MIAAARGLKCIFKGTDGALSIGGVTSYVCGRSVVLGAGEYLDIRDAVEAWDDDGDPMIIGKHGALVKARGQEGFLGVEQCGDEIVQIVPADGWSAWWRDGEGPAIQNRVCAFALFSDGRLKAMEALGDGAIEYVSCGPSTVLRHDSQGRPDEKWAEGFRKVGLPNE